MPDVIIVRDGQLVIGDIEGNSPKIGVDQAYFNQMKQHKDHQVKQFVQEKWQEYQWISRGIQQRRETILRVMHCIAKNSRNAFFMD